jgi:transposase
MGKKYEPVPNELRQQLIELIHIKGYSISNASKLVGIYYPTAKAINKVYQRENRSSKKSIRLR